VINRSGTALKPGGLKGLAANFLKDKFFGMLLCLLPVPTFACAFGLVEPQSVVSAEYQAALQVVCGVGLTVSVVVGAMLFLCLADRLDLK
jgi:hypothetical protein